VGAVSLDAPDVAQAVLPVGAVDDLDRPHVQHHRVLCSGCERDVSDTRKAHRVGRTYLADHVAVDVDAEQVPVFGWYCDYCHRVLALDPNRTDDELGPGAGWLAVDATLANGHRGHVLVPSEVVLG